MLLLDLTYNSECDWFVELSDNKLYDSKLSDNCPITTWQVN